MPFHTRFVRKVRKFFRIASEEGFGTAARRTRKYFSKKIKKILYGSKKTSDDLVADIVFITGCPGASHRYRVDNLVEGMSLLGVSAAVLRPYEAGKISRKNPPKAVVVFRYDDRDGVLTPLLLLLRSKGTRLFCDYDDLVFDPSLVERIDAYRRLRPEEQQSYKCGVYGYLRMLTVCGRGTASTKYLADRMTRVVPEAEVIPNTLNAAQMELAERLLQERKQAGEEKDEIRIIYGSGSKTHQEDFDVCAPALATFLKERKNARFMLVGLLDLPEYFDEVRGQIERYPLMDYLELLTVTAKAHINIAPLADAPFNHAKSELKIFEAGIVKAPTIASPSESYVRYITDGYDGFIAETREDWLHLLVRLADDKSLREKMGERARDTALSKSHYLDAAKAALGVYGVIPANMDWNAVEERARKHAGEFHSLSLDRMRIAWIIPGLPMNSGGHRNILRAAYQLENFGHEIELYFTGENSSAAELSQRVHRHFYPIRGRCFPYSGSMGVNDVIFATHWSTVEHALRHKASTREIMYFVQDFEPYFVAMSSEFIMAENTYKQGLYHITSGPWCEVFLKRDYNAEADHFVFPVDKNTYYPRPRKETKPHIVFFAKPEIPRRCYELGLAALKAFHACWQQDVKITFFGSKNVDPKSVPFPFEYLSVVPTIDDLAALYSDADLGLVFSTTNPSLVPYEMMACGLPVVDLDRGDNIYNYGNRRDIAFLGDPRPEIMGRQMAELLMNKEQLRQRREKGLEFVAGFPSEEEMGKRVETLIRERMKRHVAKCVGVKEPLIQNSPENNEARPCRRS